MTRALALALTATLILTAAPAAADEPGRWVDFGVFNGLADCESSPVSKPALSTPGTPEYAAEIRVDQTGTSGERSWAQFLPSTWDRVAQARGKPHLVGKDPARVTLAQVLRQAIWLLRNVGADQWTCDRVHGRFGDGTGPRYVTGELRFPKNPERCARNLRNRWGRSWRVARQVCGVS